MQARGAGPTIAPQDAAKRLAGEAAAELVRDGDVVGLGTGSTAIHMVRRLGVLVNGGLRVRGIPTSVATEAAAREAGIPLATLEEVDAIDITIDGADEVAPNLDLVKGLGGALLREKVVASQSKRLVIVVDDSKLVDRLGSKAPVPVEVVPFAMSVIRRRLLSIGMKSDLRSIPAGGPFRTDNGNLILDVRTGPISDPAALDETLHHMAGVVETGLFLSMASRVFVAQASGTLRELSRDEPKVAGKR
ncbi:MAG: ribose-5-phosphate isomerase RpiA [Thermoplasmatota archaeon]